MKKFTEWSRLWIPRIWSVMLVILITATTASAAIWSVKFLLRVLGVL